MRLFLRSLLVLTLILAAVPIVQASTPVNAPAAPLDDEIILMSNDGRIIVRDPYTPPGIRPVTWESPGTGFTNVITGDFNGDTAAEVVGLRYNEAVVFSPVVLPGSADLSRTFTASSGQFWTQGVTGDVDGDGRDELVLIQTTNEPTLAIRLYAYDWQAATGWTQTYTAGYGAPWQAISMGDVDGDGKDEFVGVRNPSGQLPQIIVFKPSNNWQQQVRFDANFPWITVAVGNTNNDANGRDEMVTTRSEVVTNVWSMGVFRYTGSSTNLDTVASAKFYPYFQDIALGDVNNSGVDTIFLLRPGIFNGSPTVALFNVFYGTGAFTQFNELANQTRYQTIHTGDLDGDTRAELVVMASNSYLIYNDPATSTNFSDTPGNYSGTTNFAIANLDGPGIPTGPSLNVSPTTLTWNVQAGQVTSQQVQITNTGTGTLNWTAAVTAGGNWLSINPSGGTAPSAMGLTGSATSLQPGVYTGKVRVTGTGSVYNSPIDINVTMTVTAPAFSVEPGSVSWYYRPGSSPGQRNVIVKGPSINWHAGAVPTSMVPEIEAAIAAGTPMRIENGRLLIGDQPAPEDVPIVDWIDINPSTGTATQSGTTVQLNLVTNAVDYGLSSAAVVFVADQVASPPAVVVRASVLRSLPDQSDLTFMPLVQLR